MVLSLHIEDYEIAEIINTRLKVRGLNMICIHLYMDKQTASASPALSV